MTRTILVKLGAAATDAAGLSAARAEGNAAAATGVRARLTPETWVDAATDVLVDQGIDHVRVDVLAGQLGVTRGSFYWHFRDREDLLRRVLKAWQEHATGALTQRLEQAHGNSPQQQLRDLISLPHRGRAASRAARIELAIRAWARRDQMARAVLDEADASRIAYHAQVFEALGFAPEESRLRAFTLYGLEVAESLLHRQGDAAAQRERREFVERLMLAPLPRPASS
jgi:AcrR family transcriptional regulator